MKQRPLLAGALLAAAAIAAGAAMLGRAPEFNPNLAGTPRQCMDDSRYPHDWTHGDPTVGIPTSPTGDNGYYYLNVIACSTTIEGKIWTSNGKWRIDIDNGYDHATPLVEQTAMTPFSLTYTGAYVGQFLRIRFANESGLVRPDHASAYSSDNCALVGAPTDTSQVPLTTPCSPDPSSGSDPQPSPTGAPPPAATPTPAATSTPAPTPAPTPSPGSSTAPPQTPAPPPAPGTGCGTGVVRTGTVSGTSVSFFFTAHSTTLCAQLTWSGASASDLIIYTDGSGTTVLAQNDQATSGELLRVAVTPGNTFKVKVKPVSGTTSFTLVVAT